MNRKSLQDNIIEKLSPEKRKLALLFIGQLKKENRFFVDESDLFNYVNYRGDPRDPKWIEEEFKPFGRFFMSHFRLHLPQFQRGENIDVKIPFSLLKGKGPKKLCFLQCEECGGYFVRFSHRSKLCGLCRVEKKSTLRKERRVAAKMKRMVRKCPVCQNDIPPIISAKRVYCSGKCRTEACRERKK